MIGIARVETPHGPARRRPTAAARARAGRAARAPRLLALELAAGAFYEGRVSELRRWADPAVEATQDDALLPTGAEALAALGALWAGDPVAAAPLLDSATRAWTRSPTRARVLPRDRVLRRRSRSPVRALRGRCRDDARALSSSRDRQSARW